MHDNTKKLVSFFPALIDATNGFQARKKVSCAEEEIIFINKV
jgi:hypothetical protein